MKQEPHAPEGAPPEWRLLTSASPWSLGRNSWFHELSKNRGLNPQAWLALAAREGVLGLLPSALPEDFDKASAPPWLDRLQEEWAASALRAEHQLREMARLTGILDQLSIEGLFFKGPRFAGRYYGDPAARRSSDVDLLIHEQDWSRLHRELIREGFLPRFSLDDRQRRALARWQSALSYSTRHLQLDVHWRLYDPPWEWRHDPWSGRATDDLRAFSVLDDAIHATAHGFQHGWNQLIHVWDVAAVWTRLAADQLDALADVAAASHKQTALGVTAGLVEELAGWSLPPDATALQALKERHAPRARQTIHRLMALRQRAGTETHRWVSSGFGPAVSGPLLDRIRDRLHIPARRWFLPTGLDIEAVRLPDPLGRLYPLVRVTRLLLRKGRRFYFADRAARAPEEIRLSNEKAAGWLNDLTSRRIAVLLRVRGASMFPFIRSGDTVRIEPRNGTPPRPGEVVAALPAGGRFVVHRVIRWDDARRRALLRGDACLRSDGWVSDEALVGIVSERRRRGVTRRLNVPGFAVRFWMGAWPLTNLAGTLYRRVGWRLWARRPWRTPTPP